MQLFMKNEIAISPIEFSFYFDSLPYKKKKIKTVSQIKIYNESFSLLLHR